MVQIAEKIGKSCSYVSDRLRVLYRLHLRVRERLSFPRGKTSVLTVSHAEHLSLIDYPKQQLRLAKLIEEKKLSVRWLERMVRRLRRMEENMPEVPQLPMQEFKVLKQLKPKTLTQSFSIRPLRRKALYLCYREILLSKANGDVCNATIKG